MHRDNTDEATRTEFVNFFSILQCPAFAQEGLPRNGTWRGLWGTPGDTMNHLVVVMSWSSVGIGGIVNPGRNSVELETASLLVFQ